MTFFPRFLNKYKFEDVIGNKYNRLVIYKGDMFHASLEYFGSDIHTGRLFQVFFFNTAHS